MLGHIRARVTLKLPSNFHKNSKSLFTIYFLHPLSQLRNRVYLPLQKLQGVWYEWVIVGSFFFGWGGGEWWARDLKMPAAVRNTDSYASTRKYRGMHCSSAPTMPGVPQMIPQSLTLTIKSFHSFQSGEF